VSVHHPGRRTIHLPRVADVTNLDDGSVIARGVDSIQVDFPDRGTRVFLLQP